MTRRDRRQPLGAGAFWVLVFGGLIGSAFGGYLLDAWVASAEFVNSLIP